MLGILAHAVSPPAVSCSAWRPSARSVSLRLLGLVKVVWAPSVSALVTSFVPVAAPSGEHRPSQISIVAEEVSRSGVTFVVVVLFDGRASVSVAEIAPRTATVTDGSVSENGCEPPTAAGISISSMGIRRMSP